MRQRKGNGRMDDRILDEEEERFTEALTAQESHAEGSGVAEINDDPSAQIAWSMGSVCLASMPPHIGRKNRYSYAFMDLLVYFMNLAKRRGDGERLAELNRLYRSALGRTCHKKG